MFINSISRIVTSCLIFTIFLTTPMRGASASSSSESERLEKLERAVEQLQQRNTELEKEVRGLKKELAGGSSAPAASPSVDADGTRKPVISYDGKTYVEKSAPVTEEKKSIFAVARGSEIKLTLGGFIQINF